jgi:DNA-directed RNA polymerase specialized sigma24 family protein
MKNTARAKKWFGKERTDTTARNATLENFIQDYGKKAFRFAYKLSGNTEAANELLQEASYRVLRNWDRYDQSKSLSA